MRKTLHLLLLLTLFAPLASPASAQDIYLPEDSLGKGSKVQVDTIEPLQLDNQFARVEALADASGVLVRWEMASEADIFGYFVYRIENGQQVRVNKTVLRSSNGSAGSSGSQAAEVHKLFDTDGRPGSRYVVEAIGLHGNLIFSGTERAKNARDIEQYTGESIKLPVEETLSKNSSVESAMMLMPDELQATVKASTRVPDVSAQRFVASQPGVRISVRNQGLYRVSRAELAAAGFDLTTPVSNWRLFVEGHEEAIIVEPSGQYIEFFGKPIDTVESDTQIYYLIGGTVAGKRIQQRAIRPLGAISAQSFETQMDRKERTSYRNDILNGDAENYWGRHLVGESLDPIGFNLSAVDQSASVARVTIKILGLSFTQHQIKPVLNGVPLEPFSSEGRSPYSATYEISPSKLLNGGNSLHLSTANNSDVNYFDSVTVSYARRYVAEQGRLSFFTNGPRKVELEGFSSPNVRVFDTTVDGSPTLVRNAAIVPVGGTYRAHVPAGRSGVFYAVEDSAVLSPASVVQNKPSSLSTSNNSADLVIISHGSAEFMSASEAWADYRRGQGFTVKVIDVNDIFDEFSYGALTADAINGFLKYAYQNWQAPPKYVMLMGDAAHDSRNYEGFGYWNMVPTKMVGTVYGETSSDEALADFDNDGLAEMAVGRIAMRNVDDIKTVFDKTKLFETPAMQSLNRGALFAYDLSGGWDFQGMSEELRNELPAGVPASMVSRATSGAQTTLINELSTGKFIANYSGHGSTGLWAHVNFFGINNVSQLTNTNPTIFTMLTCLNGYFVQTLNDSLSDQLLKSKTGGAVAAWASSGETTADLQLIMAKRFYSQLVAGKINRIGDLIRDAKTTLPDGRDVRLSWVLLGDPMLKVR